MKPSVPVFVSLQVSHEFAINFNPTNPFCYGELFFVDLTAALKTKALLNLSSTYIIGLKLTIFCNRLLC